jgi:hypothetical protein
MTTSGLGLFLWLMTAAFGTVLLAGLVYGLAWVATKAVKRAWDD